MRKTSLNLEYLHSQITCGLSFTFNIEKKKLLGPELFRLFPCPIENLKSLKELNDMLKTIRHMTRFAGYICHQNNHKNNFRKNSNKIVEIFHNKKLTKIPFLHQIEELRSLKLLKVHDQKSVTNLTNVKLSRSFFIKKLNKKSSEKKIYVGKIRHNFNIMCDR